MANKKTEPLYMSTKEACARYSIGKTTLFALFHLEDCPPIGKIGNQKRIPVKEFDAFFEKVLMEGYYKPPTFSDEQAQQAVAQMQQTENVQINPHGRQQPDYSAFGRYVLQLMRDPTIKAEYEEWLKKGAPGCGH